MTATLEHQLAEQGKLLAAVQTKHDEIAAELSRLREAEKVKVWPQSGDHCYVAAQYGNIHHIVFGILTESEVRAAIALGLCFRTRPEAEAQLDAMKVVAELRTCEGAKGFEVDVWNFCIIPTLRAAVMPQICTDQWRDSDRGWQSIYFDSEESTRAAIAKVGEARILKAALWLACRKVGE